MIVSDLEHVTGQIGLTPALRKAIEFLQHARAQELPDGRVDIDGSNIYALTQSYETVRDSEPKFEAHRKYIDVQYVAKGTEIIGWAPLERLTVKIPYDEAKDACFGNVPPDEVTSVRLAAGQLAVLYPSDAHAPRMAAGTPAPVKKIVVKVAV